MLKRLISYPQTYLFLLVPTLAALYFLFTGQWWAAFFALFCALLLFQVLRTNATLYRYTQLLARLIKGEVKSEVKDKIKSDVAHDDRLNFAPVDSTELGQLARVLNLFAERHRRLSAKRERDRDRFYTVLRRMGSGALLLNRQGRVRFINAPAAEFLRVDPERVLRRSFPQVVWDYRITEVWQRCQQSQHEEIETIDLDSGRSVRVIVTPFLKSVDSGWLVLLDDLSPVRRLERVRRDFVSNVSHELRTPLASLRALVETLHDGALDDPPAAQRFLNRIEVEVDKMTQMVEELLELSRIESGQTPLRLQTTSIHQLVESSVERLATQAERAGVDLRVELPNLLPPVLIDPNRMQQVMLNLIHNAIKFTPSGGRITIRTRQATDKITILVQDTGVGIPSVDLLRIFERFYKADRARSGEGTGLGLAIAKHIVQIHGGEIGVKSVEGEGSTFYFTVAMAPPPGEAVKAEESEPQA